jgi:ABC-type multidrug transport system fused ATPase/permease subunit
MHNIVYGNEVTDEYRLTEVMKATRLYDNFFLRNTREAGVDSSGLAYAARKRMQDLIGERGCKLSGGEIQRLVIARELYKEPSILMFDEAVTGLDTETNYQLNRTILSLSKIRKEDGERKYTIILVTHDLNVAEQADQIVMLNNGKIEGIGTTDELEKNSEMYLKLRSYKRPEYSPSSGEGKVKKVA